MLPQHLDPPKRLLGVLCLFAIITLGCIDPYWNAEEPIGCTPTGCPPGTYAAGNQKPGCGGSCVPFDSCPPWAWPVLTENCLYCATTSDEGDLAYVGGVSSIDGSCDTVTMDPDATADRLVVARAVLAVDLAPGGDGSFDLEMRDFNDDLMCTWGFRTLAEATDDMCANCTLSALVHIDAFEQTGDRCGQLFYDGSIGGRTLNGMIAEWGFGADYHHYSGATYHNVLWSGPAPWLPSHEAEIDGTVVHAEYIIMSWYRDG